MRRRPRIYYSDTQKALMWERWKRGWTLQEIGKLFDRAHSSIHRILAETGGFRPAQRSRAAIALTLAEREEISRAMVSGESIRSIATRLGRASSTISREIKRNGGCDGFCNLPVSPRRPYTQTGIHESPADSLERSIR